MHVSLVLYIHECQGRLFYARGQLKRLSVTLDRLLLLPHDTFDVYTAFMIGATLPLGSKEALISQVEIPRLWVHIVRRARNNKRGQRSAYMQYSHNVILFIPALCPSTLTEFSRLRLEQATISFCDVGISLLFFPPACETSPLAELKILQQ